MVGAGGKNERKELNESSETTTLVSLGSLF